MKKNLFYIQISIISIFLSGCAVKVVHTPEAVSPEILQLSPSKLKNMCDNNNYKGCLALGSKYLNGDGVAKNIQKAEVVFSKACDGGEMAGCFILGTLHLGLLDVVNKQKAIAFYTKACNGGFDMACKVLE